MQSQVSLERGQKLVAGAGLNSAPGSEHDLSITKHSSATASRRNIQPVLNKNRRNRTNQATNSMTSSQKEAFLNADVLSLLNPTQKRVKNRNVSATALSMQNPATMGVKQFARPAPQGGSSENEWNTGIRKLMSKVQELNSDKSMYLMNPGKIRNSSTPSSNRQQAIIKRGKMIFGRPKAEAQDWRPTADNYVSPGGNVAKLHEHFAFYPEQDRLSKLQLSVTTPQHLAEAASQVNAKGETSQQFEYLVNKTILNDDNKELSKKANRLTKLNELCKKTNKDVIQIRKECRLGNYEIDPAFQQSRNRMMAAKSVNPAEAYSDVKKQFLSGANAKRKQPVATKPIQILTPLDAITAGINLLYEMDDFDDNPSNQPAVIAESNAVAALNSSGVVDYNDKGEPLLPKIDASYAASSPRDLYNQWSQRQTIYKGRDQRGRNKGRVKSGSPRNRSPTDNSSPTTISKSYLTRRAMGDSSKNLAAQRKRVQSALNKKFRQIAAQGPTPIGKEMPTETKAGQYQGARMLQNGGRRTQSAVFRPLTNVGFSANKQDNQSLYQLSNLRSSHPLLALRPESSATGGLRAGPQLSADQVIQLLNQHVERKLAEKPDALQSEDERKAMIDKAIRQIFNSSQQPAAQQQMTQDKGDIDIKAAPDRDTNQAQKLDNLIQLQKQSTMLESLTDKKPEENLNSFNENQVDDEDLKPKTRPLTQSSILTDQLSDHVKSQPRQGEKDRNSQIMVQVTDVEVDGGVAVPPTGMMMPVNVPPLKHYKSSYDQVRRAYGDRGTGSLVQDQSTISKGKTTVNRRRSSLSAGGDRRPPSATDIGHKGYKSAMTRKSSKGTLAGEQTLKVSTTEEKHPSVNEKQSQPQQQQNPQMNRDLLEHEMAVGQNMMFGAKNEAEVFDDDDYAYQKQRKMKENNKRLTALSYDTGKCKGKLTQAPLEPVLKQNGRGPIPEPSRVTKLALQDSAKADMRLTELYKATIEGFKKKLYDQKQEVVLARVRAQERKNEASSSLPRNAKNHDHKAHKGTKHSKSHQKKRTPSKNSKSHVFRREVDKLSPDQDRRVRKGGSLSARSSCSGQQSARSKQSHQISERLSSQSSARRAVQQLTKMKSARSKASDNKSTKSKASHKSRASDYSPKRDQKQKNEEEELKEKDSIKEEEKEKVGELNQTAPPKQSLPTPSLLKKVNSALAQKFTKKLTLRENRKRRMTIMNSNPLSQVTEGAENSEATNLPINIKILKPVGKQEKKTRKLMDIIKGYENEKLRQHLSPEEVEFVDIIDEYRTMIDEGRPKSRIDQILGLSGSVTLPIVEKDPSLQVVNGVLSMLKPAPQSQPEADSVKQIESAALPSQPPQLKHTEAWSRDRIHHSRNVDCKTLFFLEEQDTYATKVQQIATKKLKHAKESFGDFIDLYEPIEIVRNGTADAADCLLSHPDTSSFSYELDHGFKINNQFVHGSRLKHDCKLDDQEIAYLAGNRDPRLTKSEPDLNKFFLYDTDVSKSRKGEKPRDEKVDLKYVRPSFDDLDTSMRFKNVDFVHANKRLDFEKLKKTVLQPEQDNIDFVKKITSTSKGKIANLARAECDFMVREGVNFAKFEEKLEMIVDADLIRSIENMGQIPKSKFLSTREVLALEEEFAKQDDKVPLVSSLIEHQEHLDLVEFDEVTENTPLDASVEIQRFGLSKVPIRLELKTVVEKVIEAPIQLLWLLRIDDMLKEAIANEFKSPFNPAEILENFQMEFNIVNIDCFRRKLQKLRSRECKVLPFYPDFYRSKLLKGAMDFFNEKVVQREEQQIAITLRFSRPQMKRANREKLLLEGKCFKPDWHVTSGDALQKFKRSRGMPGIVDARRDNSMQLYVSHDTGSVSNHFYLPKHKIHHVYNSNVRQIIALTMARAKQSGQSIDYYSDSEEEDDEEYEQGHDPFSVDSETSLTTTIGFLNRLKSSPDKAHLRQNRPHTLATFQKPICRELKPVKIRLGPSFFRQSSHDNNQAIIVLQQHDSGDQERFLRMPIKLHEQFRHIWNFRVDVYDEPRRGPLSVHHEIVPEGQSPNDFNNRDFSFFDIVVPERTPEAIRAKQAETRELLELKVLAFQRRKEFGEESKGTTMERKTLKSSLKVDVSLDRQPKRLGFEDGDSSRSPKLQKNLQQPMMKKSSSKVKHKAGQQHHHKNKKTKSKKKVTMQDSSIAPAGSARKIIELRRSSSEESRASKSHLRVSSRGASSHDRGTKRTKSGKANHSHERSIDSTPSVTPTNQHGTAKSNSHLSYHSNIDVSAFNNSRPKSGARSRKTAN